MKKHKVLLLLIFIFQSVVGQSIYKATSGEITFYSYAPLEDIKATTSQINSFINVSKSEIAFIVPMRSFIFEKSLMQEHFNEKYIESEKYPLATYNASISEQIDFSKKGILKIKTKGVMKLHGQEKLLEEEGEMEIKEDTIILSADFFIALEDFKITVPQLLFKNIADTVEVKLKAVYIPYKPTETEKKK